MPKDNKQFKANFKKVYDDLYTLHPSSNNDEFRFRYLRVDWFFPQHIHNVLKQTKELGKRYFLEDDLEMALYGGLLHDVGLVYKRDTASPLGHEDRSGEYARDALTPLGYSNEFIEKVCECIKATEPSYHSTIPEALLVRNADAYAHMISMHFFAKANFSKDIASFIDWFSSKLDTTYSKITVPELQEELRPTVSFYKKMIENYENYQERDILTLTDDL
mgnify:CR=1 FL=1